MELSKAELYDLNTKAWAFAPTYPNVAAKLDTSIKKNTAFVKKLKLGISKESLKSYLDELRVVSLSKYLSEIISTLALETLGKISGKPEDLQSAVLIISGLHQRFGAEFTEPFYDLWLNNFDCESQLQNVMLDKELIAALKSITNQIFIMAQLQIVGCVPKLDDLVSFKTSLPKFALNKIHKESSILVTVLKEVLNYKFKTGITTYLITTRFVKTFPDIFVQNSDANTAGSEDLYGMDQDLHQTLKSMFKLITQTCVDQINTINTKIPKLFKEVEKSQIRTGKSTNDHTEKYELMEKTLKYFYQSAEILCPIYNTEIPLKLEDVLLSHSALGETPELITNKIKPLHQRIWETDEIKAFYEKLPDLLPPAEKVHEGDEDDEQTRRAKRNEFFLKLESVKNVAELDALSTSYQLIGVDGKTTRKRLLTFIIELKDWNKINLYARFLATCASVFPELMEKLIEYLDSGFRSQLHSGKINVKNILFYCELVEFRLVPAFMIFHKIRTLILNLNVPNNIEIISILFEQIGRLLLNHPDYQENMNKMVDLLREKSKSFSLSMQAKLQIESTLLLLFPPSLTVVNGGTNANRSENPEINFLYYLIRKEINSLHARTITELIKKANWDDKEVYGALIDIFSKPENVDYNSIPKFTHILFSLQVSHRSFVNEVIDMVIETVQCGLENNNFTKNMARLSQVKYLVELFNHDTISFEVLLDFAYKFIKFGHKTLFLNDVSELDLPTNYFRVNLICTLLLGLDISRKQTKLFFQKKLKLYMRYFEYYIFTKEAPLPMDIQIKVNATFKCISDQLVDGFVQTVTLKECANKLIENLREMDEYKSVAEEESDSDEEEQDNDVSDVEEAGDISASSSDEETDSDSGDESGETDSDSSDGSGSGSELDLDFADDDEVDEEEDDDDDDDAFLSMSRDLELKRIAEEFDKKMATEEEINAHADFDKQFQTMMQDSMNSRRNEKFTTNSVIPVIRSSTVSAPSMAEPFQKRNDMLTNENGPKTSPSGGVAFKFLTRHGKKIDSKTLHVPSTVSFVSEVIKEDTKRKDEREKIKNIVLNNLEI